MNEIKQLLIRLDKEVGEELFNKEGELKENEFLTFKTSCKVDLGINYFYLAIDKKYKYLYYKTNCDNTLYYEALINQDGFIKWSNSHSNMANSYNSILSLKEFANEIIQKFKENKKNISFSKSEYCYHFDKEEIKYPISIENCHIFSKSEHHTIKNIESKLRIKFNNREQNCRRCGKYTVLDDSHLVSAHNIKNLTLDGFKAYYSAKFFDDLKNKPFTSLMTISDNFMNEQNRNFKIACFCKECENLFKKTDDNSFDSIKEIEIDMLYKSFGIYSQEVTYNLELIEKLENEYHGNHKSYLINSLTKHRSINEKNIIDKLLNDLKNDKLKINSFNLKYKLVKKAFIETVSLSFFKNNFYLIYITNKSDVMYVNIFTNDPKFPRDHRWLFNILYAAITINKFTFYSKEFYDDIKSIAYNSIYDYYNNDIDKEISHPLDVTKFDYGKGIKNILSNYVDISDDYNMRICSIYPDL